MAEAKSQALPCEGSIATAEFTPTRLTVAPEKQPTGGKKVQPTLTNSKITEDQNMSNCTQVHYMLMSASSKTCIDTVTDLRSFALHLRQCHFWYFDEVTRQFRRLAKLPVLHTLNI